MISTQSRNGHLAKNTGHALGISGFFALMTAIAACSNDTNSARDWGDADAGYGGQAGSGQAGHAGQAGAGGASGSGQAGTGGSDGGASLPSAGCGKTAAPGTLTRHITVKSVDRTFTQVIPKVYDPKVPHPLMFRFHGLGATGAGAASEIGLAIPAITVGPDALTSGGYWDTSGDLALVDAIIDTLSKELCVDLARGFATGYSNGGFMADAVGCSRSKMFRGIAIMEGGSSGGNCGQTGVFIMHNADDTSVPLDSYGIPLRDKWIATNGCAKTSHAVTPAPCVAYDSCSAGHPVVWCSPPTGGHKPNYSISLGIGPFFDSL